MGFRHGRRAIDLLIALWHDHDAADADDHAGITRTGPKCPVCFPLHHFLGWSWEEYTRWVRDSSTQPERKERTIGTRGLTGVIVDGTAKTSYNHFDSYPEALGVKTLKWLGVLDSAGKEFTTEKRWPTLADAARAVVLLDESQPASPEVIEKLTPYANFGVGSGEPTDVYCLTRSLQGDLGGQLSVGYMVDAGDFARDSLFCEWGYIVNFDEMTFEVYEGFRKEPTTEGFWKGQEPAEKRGGSGSTYYPIQRVQAWPLDALPTPEEFLAAFKSGDDE